MIRINCNLDLSGIQDINLKMNNTLLSMIELMAQSYVDEVKRDITQKHVIDHGNLKNSFLIVRKFGGADVVSGVNYLWFQNDGTGIYGKYHRPIKPKRKKFLVFDIAGKTIFAKQVKGVKGQHFVEDSLDKTEDPTNISTMLVTAMRMNGLI